MKNFKKVLSNEGYALHTQSSMNFKKILSNEECASQTGSFMNRGGL